MKFTNAFLILGLSLVVVSCGKNGSDKKDSNKPNVESTKNDPTLNDTNTPSSDNPTSNSNKKDEVEDQKDKPSISSTTRHQSLVRKSTINGYTKALALYFIHVNGKKVDFISADVVGNDSSECAVSQEKWNKSLESKLLSNSLVNEDIERMVALKSVQDGDLVLSVTGIDCPIFDFSDNDVELNVVAYVDGSREKFKF